jgi:hypothetical protein
MGFVGASNAEWQETTTPMMMAHDYAPCVITANDHAATTPSSFLDQLTFSDERSCHSRGCDGQSF